MDAMTKFAPAYFEYTKNAIQGQVSQAPWIVLGLMIASNCIGQDLRFFQDWIQEFCHGSNDADERLDHGESLLRKSVLIGQCLSVVSFSCSSSRFTTYW